MISDTIDLNAFTYRFQPDPLKDSFWKSTDSHFSTKTFSTFSTGGLHVDRTRFDYHMAAGTILYAL